MIFAKLYIERLIQNPVYSSTRWLPFPAVAGGVAALSAVFSPNEAEAVLIKNMLFSDAAGVVLATTTFVITDVYGVTLFTIGRGAGGASPIGQSFYIPVYHVLPGNKLGLTCTVTGSGDDTTFISVSYQLVSRGSPRDHDGSGKKSAAIPGMAPTFTEKSLSND